MQHPLITFITRVGLSSVFGALYGMSLILKAPESRVSKSKYCQLDAMCSGIEQDQEQLLSEDAASLD